MNKYHIPDEDIPKLVKQHRDWGMVTVPESLTTGLTPEQEQDLKIILEDRRVTDLSAQYWMKLRRDDIQKLEKEVEKLRSFYKEVAWRTSNHDVLEDCAVVYPDKLGPILEKIDPEWWRNS
jgi:hypothetical protein